MDLGKFDALRRVTGQVRIHLKSKNLAGSYWQQLTAGKGVFSKIVAPGKQSQAQVEDHRAKSI